METYVSIVSTHNLCSLLFYFPGYYLDCICWSPRLVPARWGVNRDPLPVPRPPKAKATGRWGSGRNQSPGLGVGGASLDCSNAFKAPNADAQSPNAQRHSGPVGHSPVERSCPVLGMWELPASFPASLLILDQTLSSVVADSHNDVSFSLEHKHWGNVSDRVQDRKTRSLTNCWRHSPVCLSFLPEINQKG